ncbi:hypothetical protein DFJ74DRAFT_433348 [Hyaloraphidium curvatum]|nr:hypothetical protein DFJ74DRAFT_433348 [Hyaloraphidium curvatum]
MSRLRASLEHRQVGGHDLRSGGRLIAASITHRGCAEDETFIRASNHRAFLRAIRAAKPELYRDEMPTGSRYNVEAGPSVLFRVVLEDHFSNPPAPKSLERGLTNLAKFAKALENHAVGFNTAHHGTSTMVIAKADHEQFISEVKRHRDWSTMWERTTRESSSVQGSESDDESGSSESSDLSSLSVSLLDD